MAELISKKTTVAKKAVSFRVKTSTADQLIALRNRVKTAGSDIEFHLDAVVDDQLVKLIAKANKQLDALNNSA